MANHDLISVYQRVLQGVLEDSRRLPSLPDIAMKIRDAIAGENVTVNSLTALIAKDPALTAHLIKSASSPIYRRPVAPKTLSEVVGLLGFSATNSLVLLYSTRNMLVLKDAVAKKLFSYTWERLVVKTALASFLAQKLGYRKVDQVQMAMLLTEVGSLSVLSAMIDSEKVPDAEIYFQMCREYSKTLGCMLLEKWKVDPEIIDVTRQCGQWEETWEETLNLLDIANLALYYTVLQTVKDAALPNIETLAAYKKIPQPLTEMTKPNWLAVITDNQAEIDSIINSFK
jgi:HD-like signal output (HDOD) protein